MATQKLILNQEVDRLGAAGDVVEVRSGYARNLLIPRGWATPWTPGAQKQIDALKKSRQARQLADRDEAIALKEKLEATTATIEMKAGDSGRLFGAVTAAQVAEALTAATGTEFDRRQVALAEHVKKAGKYTATVRVHDEITATANFEVIGKR